MYWLNWQILFVNSTSITTNIERHRCLNFSFISSFSIFIWEQPVFMVTKSNSPIFTIFGQCGFYQPCIWITGFVLVSATSQLKFKENVPLREVVRITQSDISKPNFFIMGGLSFPRPLSYNMMQMRRLENWARLAPSVMAIIHNLSQRPLKLFTQKDSGSIPTRASNKKFILWSKSPGYTPPSPEPVESQTAPCTSKQQGSSVKNLPPTVSLSSALSINCECNSLVWHKQTFSMLWWRQTRIGIN